ncbi:MAG: hypothetical protein R3D29_05215 [Nitratireductor sp.]
MAWFVGFYGLWGLVTLAIFIRAIVISYRIEQMRGVKSRWGLPQYTNLLASAFGGSDRNRRICSDCGKRCAGCWQQSWPQCWFREVALPSWRQKIWHVRTRAPLWRKWQR